MSIEISGISIRDSLYARHHHDLFQAKQVFLRASPASLLTRKRIGKIIIRSGSIYLFTDSSGYTNNYILKKKSGDESNKNMSLPNIELESFQVELVNMTRNKHYKGFIRELDCNIDDDENGSKDLRMKMDLQVAGIGFNTRKGYYIENTNVRSNMKVSYVAANETLRFNNLVLNINNQPVSFTGSFDVGKNTHDFSLDIKSPKANYGALAKLLPAKIRKVLTKYNISSPIEIAVQVVGKTTRNS